MEIFGYEPLLDDIEDEFGIKPYDLRLLTSDYRLSTNDSHITHYPSPITHHSSPITPVDAIILAVAHAVFEEITLDELSSIMNTSPILIDVRGLFDPQEASRKGIRYRGL